MAVTNGLGDIKMQTVKRTDGPVDELLVPGLKCLDPFDDPGRIRLQLVDDLAPRLPGHELVANR